VICRSTWGLVLAALLLAGCGTVAASVDDSPAGTLTLELVDSAGAPIRPLADGEAIERGALVRFVVDVKRGDYLHLLQRNNRGISALYPSTGLAWMRADGVEHLVPQPPYIKEEDRQLGFNGEDDGKAEYLLVVAPSPRPVPADSWLPDLKSFLEGPPYIEGPLAAEGAVLSTVSVVWGLEVHDPTVPQVGGGEDSSGRDPGEVGGEEDDPKEVGGEGDDPKEVGGEGNDPKEVGGEDEEPR
jgi:hypothetical protein